MPEAYDTITPFACRGDILIVTPSQYGLIGPIYLLVGLPLLLSMPVAAGVAILRYRLYDIDRLINRTLVYGLLTAMLGLGYAGIVLVLGQLSGGVTSDPPSWSVAGATLAVAAVFQPARRRIQRAVDRRLTDAGTTRPGRSRPSVGDCGTRSTWIPCQPSC